MLVFVECRSLNKEFVMLFCLLQVIDPSCFSPSLLSHFFFFSFQLQDYTNSPSGETEVKFQLTRDTLEAMLRSMTYISEQLSSLVSMLLSVEIY